MTNSFDDERASESRPGVTSIAAASCSESHAILARRALRIQLWSYNYSPEPTGIGPVSAVWAREMQALGHEVEVVAAHPHYPSAVWGTRFMPYREVRDGIRVLRFPIWPGRRSTLQRLRQEVSYVGALSTGLPALSRPDVLVAVSPSFPALVPAMLHATIRSVPWVLWLQDILPEGASATGELTEGRLLRMARALEMRAYDSAQCIVAISDTFAENLRSKHVAETKIRRIYNPATRPVRREPRPPEHIDPRLVFTMGNVGRSQGLENIVSAFESDVRLTELNATFKIAGGGVAAPDVQANISTDRVELVGVLDDDALEHQLLKAAVAVVSQNYQSADFNVPSKLMNFLAYGIPVVAAVRPESEAARIVSRSGGGWVSSTPAEWARTLGDVLTSPGELRRRGEAGRRFASEHLGAGKLAAQFSDVLLETVDPLRGD